MVRGEESGAERRHSWKLYRRSGEGREAEQGLLEKVTGSTGARGINQSSVPSGNGAPLHWAPPCQVKHHTSSPFCGCGGRASWRRPCPGAVGEKKKKREDE